MTASPPVTFSFPVWIAMFPEFSALSPAQGQAYFIRASAMGANSCANPAFGDGVLEGLLYLLTSHFAWVGSPKDLSGNPAVTGDANPLVGRISSATQGSVSVQAEVDSAGDSSAFDAELKQSKYGLEYLARITPYRTARYLARPTLVGSFPGFGYRFGRR